MDRSFDVLEEAAKNEGGVAGSLMGAGLGLGIGTNLGTQMSSVSENMHTKFSPPSMPTQFYWIIESQQFGPSDIRQIIKMINDGKILKTTLAWKQGMENWQSIDQLEEFSNLFNQPQPPTPPTPPTQS